MSSKVEVMKKVHVVSLGCPKNRVDSEVMIGLMRGEGYTMVGSPEEADMIVVNTCAFIDSAKEESIDTILEMAQFKQDAGGHAERLVVTGCMAQRYGDQLEQEMPEVDVFLGTNQFQRINEALRGDLPERAYINEGSFLYASRDDRVNTTRGGTAYLKIAEGCNRTCSFCIIPKIRGKQVSRTIEDVVQEARFLGMAGIREVVLIAQDLTSYGTDLGDKRALFQLLQQLNEVEGIDWVRCLYMYPWNFTDELLELMRDDNKILPYVDMPLQHISGRILKSMRRNIQRDKQERLISRLRDIPGLVLRTTFIAGYPGETDEDFKALYDWVKEVEFDRVGVFPYSIEENTLAGVMEAQVEDHVKIERRDALMALQQEISLRKNQAYVGRRMKVLVDGVSEEHEYVVEGRHYGQAPDIDGVVYLSFDDGGEPALPGRFVEVVIEEANEYDLVGVVQGPAKDSRLHWTAT